MDKISASLLILGGTWGLMAHYWILRYLEIVHIHSIADALRMQTMWIDGMFLAVVGLGGWMLWKSYRSRKGNENSL